MTRAVVEMACRKLDVVPSCVFSKNRRWHVARARSAICWYLRVTFKLSYPQIGKLLGRCHKTIMHNYRAFSAALKRSEPWAMTAAQLVL